MCHNDHDAMMYLLLNNNMPGSGHLVIEVHEALGETWSFRPT